MGARWTGSNIRSLNAEFSESRLSLMTTKSAPILLRLDSNELNQFDENQISVTNSDRLRISERDVIL